MSNAEAAVSMRFAVRKLRSWAECLPPMSSNDAMLFRRVLTREADRLERDASELAPDTRCTEVA